MADNRCPPAAALMFAMGRSTHSPNVRFGWKADIASPVITSEGTSRLFGLGVAALIGATACAMKSTPTTGSGCTITWAEKLLGSTLGADAICQRIMAAIASRTAASPPAGIAVVVHSASRISATATLADGRMLPAQNVAISDAT